MRKSYLNRAVEATAQFVEDHTTVGAVREKSLRVGCQSVILSYNVAMNDWRNDYPLAQDVRDFGIDEAEDEHQPRFWTPLRIAYLLIVVVMLLAFLAYTLGPFLDALFMQPLPPPTRPREFA